MVDDSGSTLKAAAAGAWISAILLIVILAGLLLGWFSSGGGTSAGVGGIFTSILNFFGRLFGGVKGGFANVGQSFTAILAAVILFIPDTAFLGGFIADAVNAKFRYSVPSIAALAAAILNWAVSWKTDVGKPLLSEFILGSPLSNQTPTNNVAPSGGLLSGLASAFTGGPNPPAPPVITPTARPTETSIGYGVDPTRGATAALASAAAAPAAPAARSVGPPVSVASRPAARGNQSTISTNLLGGRSKQTGGGKLSGSHSSILGIPLGSKSQPAGLAILATIVMIYTLDAASGKRHGAALAVQVCIGIFTLLAYWISYYYTEGFESVLKSLIPIIIGLAAGVTCYYVFPKHHPLDPEAAPSTSPSGEQSKCSAGGGSGEFVCDAYLNGVRIGTIPT